MPIFPTRARALFLYPFAFFNSGDTKLNSREFSIMSPNWIDKTRQFPTLPLGCPSSTIGTRGLNFRVRNGNGCFPSVMIAGILMLFCLNKLYGQVSRAISTGQLNASLRLHTQPIKLVVYECPSALAGGRSNLEASFPLRCFQRLSLPNAATQRCPGRDNWYTGGSSAPVLSY